MTCMGSASLCHVFLTPVQCIWVLLTPTCHVSWFPWQVINVDAWIWWSGLIYNLCNLVATLSESHIHHSYNETRTSPSAFSAPTLTELDLGLLGWLLLLNADCYLLIPYFSDLSMTLIWLTAHFSVFVYRPCDELMTRPRSPADCLRSSKVKWNGESWR
jgi:hypothetical protein